MFSKVMTIEVAEHPHKPGDVIHIDGERWFVIAEYLNRLCDEYEADCCC